MVQSKFEKLIQGLKKIVIVDPSPQLEVKGHNLVIQAKGVSVQLVQYLKPLGFEYNRETEALMFRAAPPDKPNAQSNKGYGRY